MIEIDLGFNGTILMGLVVLMIIYWFIDKLQEQEK